MSLNLINPFMKFAAGGAGFGDNWQEIGRANATGSSDTISVSVTNMPQMLVFVSTFGSSSFADTLQVNSETGTEYAYRYQVDNAGSTVDDNNATGLRLYSNSDDNPNFEYFFINNTAGQEKYVNGKCVQRGTNSASNNINCGAFAGKSAVTAAISSIQIVDDNGNNYDAASEVVVLGFDPSASSTSGKWEPIVTTTAGSTTDSIPSGTLGSNSYKYLWGQGYCVNSGSIEVGYRIDSNTSTDYAMGYNNNGTISFLTGRSLWDSNHSAGGTEYYNFFALNIDGQAKLMIGEIMDMGGSDASSTVPSRADMFGKYIKSPDGLISTLDVTNVGGGSFQSASTYNLWGFD